MEQDQLKVYVGSSPQGCSTRTSMVSILDFGVLSVNPAGGGGSGGGSPSVPAPAASCSSLGPPWLRSATPPLPGPLLPLPFARPCGHLGSPPRCMSAPGPRVARGARAARVAVSVRGLRRALPSIEVGNSFTNRKVAAAKTEQLNQDPRQRCQHRCRAERALERAAAWRAVLLLLERFRQISAPPACSQPP